MQLYDHLGKGYRQVRRADSRIAAQILEALESSRTIVNVGAGAGSYEPTDRQVVAVEPSITMIRQRSPNAAPTVQAVANELPFAQGTFDSALAILTIHHWTELAKSLSELRRVARCKVVIFTWNPDSPGFWLANYFPEILEIDRRLFPSLSELERHLGPINVRKVLIPHDCTDGFLGSYWRRPEAYFDPRVRAAISTFSKIRNLKNGLLRLENDLKIGEWKICNQDILSKNSMDLGYRLVVSSI